jgi:molecular chaperone GrpE
MYWNGYARPVRKIPVRVLRDEDISRSEVEQPKLTTDEAARGVSSVSDEIASPAASEYDWQSMALRLQADMDNFRKRQARRADDAVAEERERLLRLILPIADNLIRALHDDGQGYDPLRQGVELTYRELMRLLEAEGVARVEALGQEFSPEVHEAVGTVTTDAEAGIVVEELESGYKLGERLLRPARVVVAV